MKLIKAPDEFLEKQVKEFDFSTMDPGEISKNMIDLMHKYKGIGLAANQVGVDAQIFVMGEKDPMTVINPIVTEVNTECPFYSAEIEHHEYYNQNKEQPYCQLIITPKIKKFKSIFKQYSR